MSLAYLETPKSWPRAATPCDLVPRWAGEFASHADWVNFAAHRLTGVVGSMGEKVGAICVDAFGRRCNIGADFRRAEEEGAFPVRYFWECEPAPAWQPIETAPSDVAIIGLRDPSQTGRQPAFIGEVYDLRKNALIDVWSGRWAVCTHWMPLPPAAAASGQGGAE